VSTVPQPAATIEFAENASAADHIMPNFWTAPADAVDLAARRHGARSNYTFVDGHAAARELATVYEPLRQVDLWNPSLAR
jgi:prepilin-type processing-associated H-X9-DG protein